MEDFDKSKEQHAQDLADASKRIVEMEEYAAQCRLTKEALEISMRRFQVFSESTFEGVVLSEDRTIIEINDQLLQLMGYSRDEA
ncbi:MAG TPA: hypothetical protein PKI80_00170, partial [Deltaproteobacteria bacterium]|nr:hypothetical protein [Deltaproteobacteria bacterium]